MSRRIIPHIRSQSNYNIKREKGWDNRFIYTKMKDYCSLNDKNYIKPKIFQDSVRKPNNNNNNLNHFKQNNDYNHIHYNPKSKTKTNFYTTNKHPFRQTNTHNINTSNSFHFHNDSFQNLDPPDKVSSLWNYLGVSEGYKELFNVVVNQLDEMQQNDFYDI
jgi:hypothetical protein